MGSFNTTCFVSQQTIVPGAESMIFPIRQQATYQPVSIVLGEKEVSQYGHTSSTCYSTGFWSYAGPVIRGKYYDYGRFELLDTPSNKANLVSFFKYLSRNLFETKAGENQFHDLGMDFRSLYDHKADYAFDQLHGIWDKMWEVAQENRLFVRDYHDEPRSLGFAVMHHEAAKYLIDEVNKKKNWNKVSFEQRSYFKRYMQDKLSEIMEFMTEMGKEQAQAHRFFSLQASRMDNFGIGDQEGTNISGHYSNVDNVVSAIEKHFGSEQFNGDLSDELIDALFEALKDNIDHRYINAGLNMFNLKLSPMVYASQDYSNDIGKSYAKMIAAVSEQVTLEIKANHGDDDFDEELDEDMPMSGA